MKLNDIIKDKAGNDFRGEVIKITDRTWVVEFDTGRIKHFTKSKLKKYYEVVE